MYYVYVLQSKVDKSTYVGYTGDLRKRFAEHNAGESEYTKHKKPFDLIYYEAYASEYDAKEREWQLKKHAQALVKLKERIKNCIKK
ncbi:MAG: GIY-YIG nuclease family protein [Patescibacteria group bacterium]|nr:GIY-YIG nuclease family protein [Patescibacteria group bacterium]